MWTNWIGIAMLAAGGMIGLHAPNDDEQVARDGTRTALAASMAVYRDAVRTYARLHPAFSGQVADTALAMPAWSQGAQPGIWRNYILSTGMIVVYAASLPEAGIGAELAVLARGSLLAGTANRAAQRIDSASAAGPAATLPQVPNLTIPDGAPVWLAWR